MKTVIETRRLILREYTSDDFDALYEILSDGQTMKYYPKPYDEKGTARWIEWSLENYKDHGFGWWAIVLKDTGEFIGDCGITMQDIDGKILPEIGYHLNKRFWRCGYAKEAAKASRDWFFENTRYDAVYSYMNADNVASYRTAASVGMKKTGEFTEPDQTLSLVYSITRQEWQEIRAK